MSDVAALASTGIPSTSTSLVVSSRLRTVLMLPAIAALVCGVWSGLARMGLPAPQFITSLVLVHGALMVGGFFGTLIGLERAVAIGARWSYLAPMLSGLAVFAMLMDTTGRFAPVLMCGAAAGMLAACVSVWQRQRVAHHAALAVAALAWLLGNAVWAVRGAIPPAVPLWACFLILTIAAERLELSRFVPTPAIARKLFGLIIGLLLAGALIASISESANPIGLRLFAAALLALAVWLLRYDIARRTLHASGLTRYMAVCLLAGYAWLAIGALAGLGGALQTGHPLRDAALHALLLGFVFSMVFGHAPVIMPAITRIALHWHRGFYVPLLLLHVTLAARVLAGFSGGFALRQWAALGNAAVLLIFIVMVATSLSRARRSKVSTR